MCSYIVEVLQGLDDQLFLLPNAVQRLGADDPTNLEHGKRKLEN
jgi:hypothetical protein